MNKSSIILFLLFLLSGSLYYIYVRDFSTIGNSIKLQDFNVTRVLDGDTIEIDNGQKVRMIGINTPEKKTFLANESASFTNQLLNKTVSIEIIEKDKYDRNLGYVFYNGKLFNEQLLQNGLAHVYIYNDDKYSNQLRNAEKEARDGEIGIWKKSKNYNCISIVQFIYLDKEESDNETLILNNDCGAMNVLIKDDATHQYKKTLENGIFEMQTKNIWNDDGDSLFIWDDEGLLVFERY
jgi:micrococcal nuclease